MPEVPAVSGTPIGQSDRPARSNGAKRSDVLAATTRAFFGSGGALAAAIPGYEPRQGQQQMAEAVADVIESGGTLLAEAGTGTGKTLAYLIPAILQRQRILISTGTKNLQEQIFFKDLPALQHAVPMPFTVTMMKGRSNYLCRHRFEMYRDGIDGNTAVPRRGHLGPRLIETGDRVLLPVIDEWSRTTTTGDRAELRDVPEDLPFWKDIAADAETCLGSDCPRYGDCFVTLMRQRAAESDVVIVNHHLLCADAAVRQGNYGEVIPSCPTLVVDEAHQLEDVATQHFGLSFSNFRIDDLLGDGGRLMATRPFGNDDARVDAALGRIADCSRAFFHGITIARARGGAAESRARYDADAIADYFEDGMLLAGALEALESLLATVNRRSASGGDAPASTDASGANEAAAALQRRAGELRHDLRLLMRADDAEYVYFLETRGRGVFLRAAPIDVSRIVRSAVLDRFRTVVLTSATLAVDASFAYLRARLGIREAEEMRVASEFDYASQALLYLPRRMPPPKAPTFAEAAARETIEILRRSRGRAFVLFTSYAVLRTVQQFVEMSLPYPILVQGSAPRSVLIEAFRSTPNAVLLATASFWQGVDVVGEALSCVIIDKLPFASPGDPVTAARIDALKADGADAFSDYQVPLAILNLQQGLGRLIRHRTDRGVLAVLDPRLQTMGYGRRFLASLPPAPVTHDIEAVGRFFA